MFLQVALSLCVDVVSVVVRETVFVIPLFIVRRHSTRR